MYNNTNVGEFHGNIRRRNPNTRISCRPGHLENYTRISGTGGVLRRTWFVCAPMAVVNAVRPRRRCKLPKITLVVSGDCYNIKLYCYIIYIQVYRILCTTRNAADDHHRPVIKEFGVAGTRQLSVIYNEKMHEFHSFTPQDCL